MCAITTRFSGSGLWSGPRNDNNCNAWRQRSRSRAQAPPTLLKGDALDLLPGVLSRAPQGLALCLYHTHTLNQFSPEARKQFADLLAEVGAGRDLYWLSSEYRPTPDGDMRPTLTLVAFEDGRRREQILAYCDHHGRWLEWLSSAA